MAYTYDRRANTGKSVEVKNWRVYLYQDSVQAYDLGQASTSPRVPVLTVVSKDKSVVNDIFKFVLTEAKKSVDFKKMLNAVQVMAQKVGAKVYTESKVW